MRETQKIPRFIKTRDGNDKTIKFITKGKRNSKAKLEVKYECMTCLRGRISLFHTTEKDNSENIGIAVKTTKESLKINRKQQWLLEKDEGGAEAHISRKAIQRITPCKEKPYVINGRKHESQDRQWIRTSNRLTSSELLSREGSGVIDLERHLAMCDVSLTSR